MSRYDQAPHERPTVRAPAYMAVRAAALRQEVAEERAARPEWYVRLWNNRGWAIGRDVAADDPGSAVRATLLWAASRGEDVPPDAQFLVRPKGDQ